MFSAFNNITMFVVFNVSCVSLYVWLDAFSWGDFYALLLRQPYASTDMRLQEKARDKSFWIEINPFISCMAFSSFLAKFYSFIKLFSYVRCSIKSVSSVNCTKTNVKTAGHNNFIKSIVE